MGDCFKFLWPFQNVRTLRKINMAWKKHPKFNLLWWVWSIFFFPKFSQLAIAGLVLKCFGSSKSAVRIGTSIAMIYCGLYLFERTVWAFNGKEKQIKMAALAFATERFNLLQSCVSSSMLTQVMAIPVMEFQVRRYKIRKIFA